MILVMPFPQSTHWPRVIVLWLCGVLAAMQFSKISFAFLALQAQYAITPAQTGLLLSTVGMVGLVFGVTVGLFAPTIGYRRLLLAGLGLGAMLALLQSLNTGYLLFWVTRVLEGASHLAVVVTAPTLIVANCAPRHRSVAMGLWSTFVGVAFTVTAATGGWVMSHFQLAGLLRLHAVGMALMFVTALLLIPAGVETPAEKRWPPLASLPRHHFMVYAQWATALPGACFFFYTLMAISLMTFVPQHGGPNGPWLAVVLPLVSILGSFSAGWTAQHLMKPALLVRLSFVGVGLAGLALWGCFWLGIGIGPAAIVLMYLAGLAGGSSYALIPSLNEASAMQARANGALAQLGNLGSTLGPPVFAGLIAAWGTAGLALPVVVFALLGAATAMSGIRRLP